uniref:Ubiquitin-fold modifier-conjugating enzyme 1 n=1 Tax=Parascaris univalens TaxID=6257 RepID=A0A915BE51_PARUN
MIFDVIFNASFSGGNALLEEIKKKMASAGIDESIKQSLKAIPLMKTKAGPRDGDLWIQRLKEEFEALITFISNNKMADTDWFRLESNSDGTKWFGKCWHYHNMLRCVFLCPSL